MTYRATNLGNTHIRAKRTVDANLQPEASKINKASRLKPIYYPIIMFQMCLPHAPQKFQVTARLYEAIISHHPGIPSPYITVLLLASLRDN
jgi:hypothetical protein